MEHNTAFFASLYAGTIIRYFVLAGIPFLLFYWLLRKYIASNKIQAAQASRKDFFREIIHSLSSSIVLTTVAILVLFTPMRQYTQVYRPADNYPVWWVPVSVVLSLVIHDTYFYWTHRLMHHKKLFRYTHLLHHRSTNPTPLASYSFHTTEAVAEGLIVLVLAFVLPMNAFALYLFTVIGFVINVYGHLGYEIMPKGFRHSFLFGMINTSVYHNLHHSKFKGNYGLYFRWWDRLMGTEHPDYVKTYDCIQEKRFGKKKTISALPEENLSVEPTAKSA